MPPHVVLRKGVVGNLRALLSEGVIVSLQVLFYEGVESPNSVQRGRTGKSPSSVQRGQTGKSPTSIHRGRAVVSPGKECDRIPRSIRRQASQRQVEPSNAELVLFDIHKKRKPQHWHFIQLVCKDEYIGMNITYLRSQHARCAYCNKCKIEIAFEKSNTAHVTRHMQKSHPKEFKKATKDEKSRKKRQTQTLVHHEATKLYLPSGVLPVATKEEQDRADDLASIWIAKSMRPFSIPMDKYFRKYARYLNTVQKRIKIIKPWKARSGIEVIASQLRDVLKDSISNQCVYYSASSDIWTSRSKLAFICFTLHYLDEMFCMQSWVLEVKHLPGKHDGSRIADSLRDIMTEWALPIEKCVKFLRDGASNGVKACEILNIDSMSCLAHSLHLVVGSGIVKKKVDKSSKEMMTTAKTDEDVDAAIEQVACEEIDAFIEESCASARADLEQLRGTVEIFRRLAVFFSRSPKALSCLKGLQTRELTPQTDCATRWNSTHAMLLRMIELRSTLDDFFGHIARTREFSDSKVEQPTAEHWFVIRCLVVLLDPFAKATDGLGGEKYPTLVLAVPVLRSIERKIKSAKIFEPITRSVGNEEFVTRVEALMQSVRQTYVKLFTERFKNKLPEELLWISVLDPRSAELKHLSDGEAKAAIAGFKFAVLEMEREMKSYRHNRDESVRVENDSAPQSTTANQNVAWLTEVFSGGTEMYVEREPTIADDKFKDECNSQVRQYLGDAHGTPVTTDALKWWSRRRGKYPFVESLARKWLGCIATSVPSERAFSKSGNVVTSKRCSLDPDIIRDTLFVSENYEEDDDSIESNSSEEEEKETEVYMSL